MKSSQENRIAFEILKRKNPEKGMIFNIQRFSIDDGPGIRTTVFMKGCPLRCPWCHNPEGIEREFQLMWFDVRCIGDKECVEACPKSALDLMPGGMIIDRSLCDACGICAAACPAGALEVVGKESTTLEVFEEVKRDEVFYRNSNGGVTVSGGEPAAQPDFVRELLMICQESKIHTALDTSGYCSPEVFEKLIEVTDMVLLDLKTLDEEKHLKFTGVPLKPILKNTHSLVVQKKRTWIRTPIIPDYTADPDNIADLACFIKDELSSVERWDLLAFNNACESKYDRLDIEWALKGVASLDSAQMDELAALARNVSGIDVHWSGPTKVKSRE